MTNIDFNNETNDIKTMAINNRKFDILIIIIIIKKLKHVWKNWSMGEVEILQAQLRGMNNI